jgi:hypothetical protein
MPAPITTTSTRRLFTKLAPQIALMDRLVGIAHGEGVFHLGFEVPDCDAGEAVGKAIGLGVLMRGRRPTRTGFAYFDTMNQVGGVIPGRRCRLSQSPSVQDAV